MLHYAEGCVFDDDHGGVDGDEAGDDDDGDAGDANDPL